MNDLPQGSFWWGRCGVRIIKDLAVPGQIANRLLRRTQRLRFTRNLCRVGALTAADKKRLRRVNFLPGAR